MADDRIRVLLHTAPGRLELGEATLPGAGPADAVVRVEACGVCATNLHGWGREPAGPGALPGTHGHEIAGVVERVGLGVRDVVPGDRVTVDPAVACGCGSCAACAAGDPMRCRSQSLPPVWGFADALVVPARSLVRLPAGLSSDTASLAEPLASAVHGLRHSHRAAADGRIDRARVLVLGAGAVGLLAVAAARHLGAAEVTVVARHDHQARAAAAVGADRVVRDHPAAAADALRTLRPDMVVEAVGGTASTLERAFALVDRGGEVVVLGIFDAPRPFDVTAAVLRNVRAYFAGAYASRDGRSDMAVAVDLLASAPVLGTLVTHRLPLARATTAVGLARDRRAGVVRVVVHP